MTVSATDELVGRDTELAELTAAVHRLGDGRASVFAIEGEAGIGKTRVVNEIIAAARARGLTVFSGRAHPFETSRPFGVVADALDLSRRSPDPRRAAIGALLAGRGAPGSGAAGGAGHHRVIEDIVDLVDSSAVRGQVLLVTEDLHWADEASLSAISAVTRQLSLSELMVVVTARLGPVSPELAQLFDDLAAAGGRTVRLRPLTAPDVTTLAHRELGARPGPELAAMLAKAGGNPLWAKAMLHSLSDSGLLRRTGSVVETATSDPPSTVGDLVVRRLRHLPAATRELLQITAALGDTVSLRDVAALARRSPAEVVSGLDAAFEANLLDEVDGRVVFRHQLVHDAIYRHMPAPSRRLLHREAAVALMAAGAPRLAVADHLMLAAEPGDDQVVAWLREAAGEASPQVPLVAVELLRRAGALLPEGHPDADLLSTELMGALLRAGRVAEVSDRAHALLARPHPAALDTPLRLTLVGALALQNRADELIDVARDALAGSAGLGPAERVPLLAQQSWALTLRGDAGDGEAAGRRALAIADEIGDPGLTVWALTGLFVAIGRQGRFDEALDHARRAAALAAASPDPRSMPLQPKVFLGLALFDCDRVAEARAAYRAALDDEFGAGWWLSDTLMADAQASFAIGEWADAVPGLVSAGQAAREKDHALLLSHSIAYRTIIATASGDYRAAGDLAAQNSSSLSAERLGYNAGIVGFAAAGVLAAEGDRRAAYELLLRCWRFDTAQQIRYYHRCLAPDLVRLALALGHRGVAHEVADAVGTDVALAPAVPTVRSVALRCRGIVDGDADAAIEAVELARRTPLLQEHAGACEDAARLLARQGRRAEATALLAEALERYRQAGAEAWAGRVRARQRALGVHHGQRGPRRRPAGGWESLTATERSVSLLVAEGLTNGAVARRLYISPHTVNSHLRRVFTKLEVSNRVALAAVVHHLAP